MGDPLFPGESENEQMQLIMEVKGLPPDEVLEQGKRSHIFFNKESEPILKRNSSGRIRQPGTKKLGELMQTDNKVFIDFIDKCTEWDVKDRLTPEQALCHEWI